MKHQFKFNPLATAILTLLCGSTVSSYAETIQPASEVDNQKLKSVVNESYPGQKFFEQYYVSNDSPEVRQRNTNAAFAKYCQNSWITPISPETKAADPAQTTSVITADDGYYNPNGDSTLQGNVVIDQAGRMVKADSLTIDKTQTYAKAKGNVQMAQSGLIAQSDEINYNLKTQTGELNNSYYIAEQTNGHGHAERIERTSPTELVLKNATYSTCPPDEKPTWHIQANEIKINQDTGRGTTKGTKLYIKDTPVLAVPYFNFPTDNRRISGIVNPSIGWNNNGGLDLSVPVYLNLAPNYDATITPRYLGGRGMMAEGEFRYLTENYGRGIMWGGYLPSDSRMDNEDRSEFHLLHEWQINDQWSTNVDYNYISDKDYYNDLGDNPAERVRMNQRRAWEINYAHGIPGLTAKLKAEDFQTLNREVDDVDRPYGRLPQLLVNYVGGNVQGFEYEYNNDTAYFRKSIDDFNGLDSRKNHAEPNGTRFYNEFAARYNFRKPWGFVIPEASVRSLHTSFDQDIVDQSDIQNPNNFNANSKSTSIVVPQFTLDTGLIFEKEGKFLQTITPRAFYAYSPYRNQDNTPNFDSSAASLNYDQLFNPKRFYGHDRLEDNDFLSLGVSYSLFDTVGLERLKASVGQSYYFSDRKVTLNSSRNDQYNTESHTGPVVSLSSQLSDNITVNANSMWMSNGDTAQRDFQVYYNTDHGSLYNVGYFYRNELTDRQEKYDQITASFIKPVKDNWRILGHVQYDMDNSIAREFLLGVNYESCCWAVTVYGRSHYNDLDEVNSADFKPRRNVMVEFTLKGLGGLNSKLSNLLEDRILGFNKVNQNWTN